MSFNNKIDYMPNQPIAGVGTDAFDLEHKRIQKRRWHVFVGANNHQCFDMEPSSRLPKPIYFAFFI